jgi:multidrug efflux system outer membrane protein
MNFQMRGRCLVSILIGLTLAGCSPTGGVYQPPTIELENQFLQSAGDGLLQAAYTDWWDDLNDPLLTDLVRRGLNKNLSIQNTLERIRVAEAVMGQNGPSAQLNGSLIGQGTLSSVDGNRSSELVGAIRGSYVVDLFGGQRSQEQQAIAQLEAAQLNSGAVRMGYIAELTSTYILARYYQDAMAITQSTITNQRGILDRVGRLREAGRATDLDVELAQAELATAQADLPQLESGFEGQVFRIATLLVESSQTIFTQMRARSGIPRPHALTASGVPADLLRNRPDVRAAERNLAATTAGIGIAESALYPALNLNGTLGLDGSSLDIASSIITPLLNRGNLLANVRIAEARTKEAENTWRASVLSAAEEVNVALSQLSAWKRQVDARARSAAAYRRVYQLTKIQFDAGKVTTTDVLLAEGLLSDSLLAAANAERGYALSWAEVHVRTGQGWLDPDPATLPN